MLSLCMIVKNEEKNLHNCLSKVTSYVDEIIIVDTGSNDKTKEIAKAYTEKIYDYEWVKDFSAARNFCISLAKHDWILVLDADEYTTNASMNEIYSFINDPKNEKKIGRIHRANTIEDASGVRKRAELVNRVFNKKYYYYQGKIHEQITSIENLVIETCVLPFYVDHIGYTKQVIIDTNKIQRNKEILIESIDESPNDPYSIYQLGKAYYMEKQYKSAYECFEQALLIKLDYSLEYVYDLVETYGYALLNSGEYSKAMQIEMYKDYYVNIADYNFLLGLVQMNNARFQDAVESFLVCTKQNKGSTEGITSFLPYYNIGVIYETLGYGDEAVTYYQLCGNYAPAQRQLKHLGK